MTATTSSSSSSSSAAAAAAPTTSAPTTTTAITTPWSSDDPTHAVEAREKLQVWPLDTANAAYLQQVHPRGYTASTDIPHPVYDLIAVGAGAGGLVSAKQSARRNAKSALISQHLAGGDCLNVGCVPSKALLVAAKMVRQVRRATQEFGVVVAVQNNNNNSNNHTNNDDVTVTVDFATIMRRLRDKRLAIAPADGHDGTVATGAHVYQGRGVFTSPTTIRVGDDGQELTFRTAVIATGGRPAIPHDIPGLRDAPYTTNEVLFNLETLPPRLVILGAGVIALEMAQAFASFGSRVTVVMRSAPLLASKQGDPEAGVLLQRELEKCGVTFVVGTTQKVTTVRERDPNDTAILPLMVVSVEQQATSSGTVVVEDYECECLLVAMGRLPNVEDLGLEAAGVDYQVGRGIIINDRAQSIGNPNIYAVGDCAAGVPRLTHVSGEMAKLVVQNGLFHDDWKVSSLVIPAVAYTEPEYATVGLSSVAMAERHGVAVDVYRGGLEHNDRAIIEGRNEAGFCKIFCKKDTDEIVGATIVAERAGEMINEVSLAIKYKIGLKALGRNIHPYPSTGEAVMACGIQCINANWQRLD